MTPSTRLTAEIRTDDQDWITRCSLGAGSDGRVVAEITNAEAVTFCGRPMLRITLAAGQPEGWPSDMIPAAWASPETRAAAIPADDGQWKSRVLADLRAGRPVRSPHHTGKGPR